MKHVRRLFAKLHVRQMLMIALILVPSLLILLLQALQERKHTEESLTLQANVIALQIAMYSKELLPEPEIYLSQLAKIPDVFADKHTCNAFMKSSLRSAFFFHNLFLASSNGDLDCSGIALETPLNLSGRDYFKDALRTKKFAMGGYQVSRAGVPVIVFALPVLDVAGNVRAVIGASARLTWFQDAFSKAIVKSPVASIAASVVDERGVVLASAPNTTLAGTPAHNWTEARKDAAKSGISVFTSTWQDGRARTSAYIVLYRSSSSNVYLRVGVPQESALAMVAHNTAQRFAILALFALAGTLAAWYVSRSFVVRPIQRLKETAAMLGSGKLNARTKLSHSGGEIGELAQHFDIMAEHLEAQHHTLSQLNRFRALRGEVNAALLRATDEITLLGDICHIVRQSGDFEFAWAGYVDRTDSSILTRRAWSAADEHLGKMVTDWKWSPESLVNDPVFTAIRTGEVCIIHDVTDPNLNADWREKVITLGGTIAIGLPIIARNKVIGGLGIYCSSADSFNDAEVKMLVETASDLGFGIHALRADKRSRQSQDLVRMIVDNIPTMIFVKDAKDLRFVSLNRAGERFIGLKESEVIGKNDYDLFPLEQADHFREKDIQALAGGQDLIVTVEAITSHEGAVVILETKKLRLLAADGSAKYLLGISEDITERYKVEERLNYLATHDHLTGLLNRHGLAAQFESDWQEALAGTRFLALLYIDLDGFKEINDTLGHAVGDGLLRAVSMVLQSSVTDQHIVSRVGGDEFIILLRDTRPPAYSISLAEEIRTRCQKPFFVDGHEIVISASIGISAYPGPVDSHEALLRSADIAMYQAKAKGRNRFMVYTPQMQSSADSRLEMRNHLRHAIEYGELTIHFQPRVSMASGRIVGAEALLRWNSPQLGFISPAAFIPLAEDTGLIVEIGAWVLKNACVQAKAWLAGESEPFHLAVNLSPRQLRQADLVTTIKTILAETGIAPHLLELEITESAIMDSESRSIDILNELSDMGIRLAVDDFGTGYSNLAYLKKLPVNVLKVDQSFVQSVTSSDSDLALVTAIVAMARSLKLSVIAEGVETRDQFEAMRDLGVSAFQGYFFSKPLPPEEFHKLLRSGAAGVDSQR